MSNEFLKHYGVQGMRWGVRRPIGPDGLVTTSSKSATGRYKKSAGLARGIGAYTGYSIGRKVGLTAGVAAALAASYSVPVTSAAILGAGATGGVLGMVAGGVLGYKGVSKIQNAMHKKKIENVLGSKLSDLDTDSRKKLQKDVRKYTKVDVTKEGSPVGTVNTRKKG